MLRLVRNIINIVIALILVLATGGFAVFQHYCSCEKVSISSVITEAVCSHDEAPQGPCCQEMPVGKECCNIHSGALPGESSCHSKHDCCSTSVSFFKTSDYFSPVKQEIKVFAPVLWELSQPEMSIEQLTGACLIACNDTSPPVPAVKLFVKYHQRKDIPDIA